MVSRWIAIALLCAFVASCGAGEVPSPTIQIEQTRAVTQPPEQTSTSVPPEPSATLIPSSLPATAAPSPVPVTAAPPPEPESWHIPGTVLLFVFGDEEQANLFALGDDGSTRLVFPNVGDEVRVSPDGGWLGFVRWQDGGYATLELHNAFSGESREIRPDTTSGLLRYAFDREGRRLAYLDLGGFSDGGVPWTLVVVDLESGESARYDAIMSDAETHPLPGSPVGWAWANSQGDELIIDTFLPYTEGGWMGVWGVSLPLEGDSAPLNDLALYEIVPGAPTYSSRLYLSPDGRELAFLGRDPNYYPQNYSAEFYDVAVNRLELASLVDGSRSRLAEITDGSALASALAWSSSGERLLYAQGHYEGESFADLSLKSTDQTGTAVEYGPLTLPPLGGLLDLAWCDASRVFYVTWDGSDGTEKLLEFDLNTGVSTEFNAGRRVKLVGCVP